MSALIPAIAAERVHWYTTTGQPCHKIQCKGDPSKFRNVTLADARKQALVPSVTNILEIMARPGLENWKQEQMILAALTLPRLPGEMDDAFAARVVEDSRAHAEAAATWGSEMHGAIASWHRDGLPMIPMGGEAGFATYCEWAKDSLFCADNEMPFVHPDLLYGGTLDIFGTVDELSAVLDIKTTKTEPGKPTKGYETWGLQLAAYAYGISHPSAKLLNVVISSNEPGRVEIVDWTDQSATLFDIFKHLFAVWKWSKKFNPGGSNA